MINNNSSGTFLVLLAVFLFLGFGCSDRDLSRKAKYFYRANDHLEAREYKQAIEFYSEAIQLDENFKDAYNNRGIALYHQGKYFEAINDYSKAIQVDSAYIDAYRNRANAYIAYEKWQRGLKDMLFVKSAYPDTAFVYFNLGILYHHLNKNKEALTSLNKAIQLDSLNVESYINRATVYFHLKDWERAKNDLKFVLARDQKQANAYNVMGLIHMEEKQLGSSIEAFNMALELEPNNPFFLNNRGLSFVFLNKMPEAEADINKSIRLKPDNAWVNRNKGIYYQRNNDHENAIRLLTLAKGQDENLPGIDYYLGISYLKNKQINLACAQFKMARDKGDERAIQALQENCASDI